MRHIPAGLRRLVIQKAANCCEYCGLSQEGQEATFHIDHVIPLAAGGETVAENLRWLVYRVHSAKQHARRWSIRKAARKWLFIIHDAIPGTSIFSGMMLIS